MVDNTVPDPSLYKGHSLSPDHKKVFESYKEAFKDNSIYAHQDYNGEFTIDTSQPPVSTPTVQVWVMHTPMQWQHEIRVRVEIGQMGLVHTQIVDDEVLYGKNAPASHAVLCEKIGQTIAHQMGLGEAEQHYIAKTVYRILFHSDKTGPFPPALSKSTTESFSHLSYELPAMNKVVEHPALGDLDSYVGELLGCATHKIAPLRKMIIHLNDAHKWSREKIADWVDELHDSGIIDAEFHIETEVEDEHRT